MSTIASFGAEDSEVLLQSLSRYARVWRLRLPGAVISQASASFCELSGYPEASLLGRPFADLISARPEAPSLDSLWQALREGEPWQGDICLTHRFDNQYWLDCLMVPLPSSAFQPGGPATEYIAFGRDISEFKHLQYTLQGVESADSYFSRREQELLKAQRLAHIGSFSVDYLTGDLDWSDETYRIFGLTPGTVKPDPQQFWSLIPEEDQSIVANSLSQVAVTGRHDIVHRIIRPDGTLRHVHVLGEAEFSENGDLLHISGTMQDITERVDAEQALIKAREEADSANRAKSDFLSSMSHELRTPLNAILGFAQLLHYDDKLSESQRDSASEIIKAGRHLLDLINDILDLSKVDAGKITLDIRPVPLKELLHSVCSLMKSLAVRQEIILQCQLDPGLAVLADRTRLKQIALNLISNAIKYNVPGGEVVISSESDSERGLVTLVIEDSGVGIPRERQAELFQPFNRLGQESSAIEGSGIGLRICQQLAHMMSGDIGMESRHPRGSRFWLSLPLAGEQS